MKIRPLTHKWTGDGTYSPDWRNKNYETKTAGPVGYAIECVNTGGYGINFILRRYLFVNHFWHQVLDPKVFGSTASARRLGEEFIAVPIDWHLLTTSGKFQMPLKIQNNLKIHRREHPNQEPDVEKLLDLWI